MAEFRIPIPEDCCGTARRLIAEGTVSPETLLEFMRGDIVSLRGTAKAFASRMLKETSSCPRHVRYAPPEIERLRGLSTRPRPPRR